jgi:7-cyano-7-deazaguanine synthase
MSGSAVVLLSAGLDSTYNIYAARAAGWDIPLALTFDYGQRAAPREIEQSRRLCQRLRLPHAVVELPWFRDFTKTSLVARTADVPTEGEVDIESLKASQATAQKVWVPNRNGILLNIAAGYAEGLGANFVIPGFNLEEASTFPDNSQAFMSALDHSLAFSTANKIQVKCFSATLDKTEIVARGAKLGVPFAELWPCYHAGQKLCGRCESCLRFARALAANGLEMPG